MSEANGREHSPEFRRGRSGAGTEADAAGAEDPRRRGGSQGHRPVRGAARVRQLVVAVAGREGRGVGDRGLHKPRNGEADAKKRLFLQKESPVPGTRKRSSWRNKCLKSIRNLTIRSVRWSAWTSSRCSKETHVPATADHPRRVDYEYERAGTASIFMFCEALSSWRRATARKRRTKVDWAEEVAGLLEGSYANCEHPGARQPQHLHAGSVLRSVLRGRGNWSSEPATRRSTGVG